MIPILKWFASLFGFRRRKSNGVSPAVQTYIDERTQMDDKVLKVIADLGGPRRSNGDSRSKKGHRIFDRR